MGNHLVLLALLAAAPHSARAGWPTGALGFAGLLAGDAPHLQSDVLRTTVEGTTLRVEETVQLAGDQSALTLGVGDTEDDEAGLDRDNKVEAAVRRGHPELRGDALDKAVNAAVAEAARAEPYAPDTPGPSWTSTPTPTARAWRRGTRSPKPSRASCMRTDRGASPPGSAG